MLCYDCLMMIYGAVRCKWIVCIDGGYGCVCSMYAMVLVLWYVTVCEVVCDQ